MVLSLALSLLYAMLYAQCTRPGPAPLRSTISPCARAIRTQPGQRTHTMHKGYAVRYCSLQSHIREWVEIRCLVPPTKIREKRPIKIQEKNEKIEGFLAYLLHFATLI